jgi:ribonuclease HII
VAACVILDPTHDPPSGIDDSKKLTAQQRDALEPRILEEALAHGIGVRSAACIDETDILRATLAAMADALAQARARLEELGRSLELVLVDGPIPFPCTLPLKCLIHGDQRSIHIAAASILAKVARDREMVRLEACHPGYGFAQHKGYGTAEHQAALARLGPSPVHRRTFRGVEQPEG